MTININIERSGFPIKIGDFEFWFDTSTEALVKFADVPQTITDRFNEYQKELVERSQNGEFDDVKEGVVDTKVVQQAIEMEKKLLEIKYDAFFGDGTFAKLYEKYPDYLALGDALEQVDELVAKELEKIQKERADKVNERTSQYLQKSEKKKRKTKK